MNNEQLEQVLDVLTNCVPEDPQACEAAIQAVRQALADAALDKMAENARELGIGLTADGKFFCDGKSCKQPAPAPAQEPVAWMHKIDFDRDDRKDFMVYYDRTPGYCIPLYTTPPAPAQPLKDEQIQKLRHTIDWTASWSYIDFARAIEAAHGITKGGEA